MNISVSQAQGKVPVTIIKLDGELDGQNYQDLIAKAREAHEGGARNFLLDLSGLTYVSSAGLVALHTVALMAGGEALPDTDARLVCDPLGRTCRQFGGPKKRQIVQPS